MLRGLLIASLALATVFSLMLGALRVQPQSDPIKTDFGGCSVPCWNGMQPGITSFQDATARFNAIGWKEDSSFCRMLSSGCTDFRWWNPDQMGQWAEIHFNVRQIDGMVIEGTNLTLGQLLQAFGAPELAYQNGIQSNSHAILYSVLWNGIGAGVVLHCPTTFAALLQRPVEAVMLSTFSDAQPLNGIAQRSFRSVCRP